MHLDDKLKNYEPDKTEQDIKNVLVESKIKQVQFNLQMGLKDYALKYIEEGLTIDPANKRLNELKNQIKN